MSAFLDIGTGAGLASATGVRPYLPPLLAGGLARGDVGIDFDGTDFAFLESTAFLAAVVAVAVIAFFAERSGPNRRSPDLGGRVGRGPLEIGTGIVGLVLGALLFAGALADGGEASGSGCCSARSARRWAGSPWAASSSACVRASSPSRPRS